VEALRVIGYRKYNGTMSVDGYPGSPTFTPPDDQPPADRNAYGWYPLSAEWPIGNNDYTQRLIASEVVGVPDPTIYAPGDLVILNGVNYIVSEDVRDFRNGPWGPGPGGCIVVEKVTG
jgi:hypothetical protein